MCTIYWFTEKEKCRQIRMLVKKSYLVYTFPMFSYVNITLGLLTVVCIGLLGSHIYLRRKIKRFMIGTDAKTYEEALVHIATRIQLLEKDRDILIEATNNLDARLRKSITHTKMVRFNPFEDAGSNQSFAIGLLNEQGDGVVVSSLYARERMSVFAKPIQQHNSSHELTTEEYSVIQK